MKFKKNLLFHFNIFTEHISIWVYITLTGKSIWTNFTANFCLCYDILDSL